MNNFITSKILRKYGGLHGLLVLSTYRFGNFVNYKVKTPILRQILWIIYKILNTFFVKIFLGCDFPAKCKLGKNIRLPHGGLGIIIHENAIIGDNVTIFQQVTIGRRNSTNLAPTIMNNVFIGAGAKILGPVIIGENSKIGANAVVIKDIPPNSTAVGVPAKLIVKPK